MSTTDTERREAVITPAQVKAINRARTVLAEIEKANLYGHDSQTSGMIVALASVAASDLFQLLNWYDSHAHGNLTGDELHNRDDA